MRNSIQVQHKCGGHIIQIQKDKREVLVRLDLLVSGGVHSPLVFASLSYLSA